MDMGQSARRCCRALKEEEGGFAEKKLAGDGGEGSSRKVVKRADWPSSGGSDIRGNGHVDRQIAGQI